ncbi:SPX domain protein involved in polyphosphate accumulation [Streptococcus rupicaprae]|uniref:SPX domain protein involved in polyphosphate accumulation n=1 Tax=Streptococcus rupicaprae TaxID=759619 RepID=A0ABV2FHP8_9STRE
MKKVNQKEFKRVETKYLVSDKQLSQLLKDMNPYLQADDFAQSTISSLYFDTEDFQMVQDSLAKKHGKEKLRLRTYDTSGSLDAPAFLEIKQKLDGVGYKYRVATTPRLAGRELAGQTSDWKMAEQLQELHDRYDNIQPRMLIRYQRQSFKGRGNQSVRVTLDKNVTYGLVTGMTLVAPFEQHLIADNQMIMEIKVATSTPAWLEEILAKYQLEKTSFSKYGQAYRLYQEHLKIRETAYA